MLEFRFASRKTAAIFTSLFFLGFGPAPSNGAETGTQEAIEQTGQEFSSIKASAKEAVEKLDSALDGLREVEGRLKLKDTEKVLSPENKAKILATIKKSRLQIARSMKVLEDFQSKAGVVTDAFDAYDALVKFKKEYGAYQAEQGPLAADLYALGTAMEKMGKIPLLGDMIVAYGKITTGMLTKIAAISTTIDEMRNQGAISGPGYYRTGKGLEKYNVLKAKNPKLADDVIYRPSIPIFVYTSDGLSDPKLIWDDEAKDFYFVAATVPLEKIFQMNLLAAQKRRTPSELKHIADRWVSYYEPLDKTAELLPALIKTFRSGEAFGAYMEIENKHQNILEGIDNADLFRAKYVFDPKNPNTRENVRQALADLHALFRTKGLNDTADKLKVFAGKHQIDLNIDTSAKTREPETSREAEPGTRKREKSSYTANTVFQHYSGSAESLKPRTPAGAESKIQSNTGKFNSETTLEWQYWNKDHTLMDGLVSVQIGVRLINSSERSEIQRDIQRVMTECACSRSEAMALHREALAFQRVTGWAQLVQHTKAIVIDKSPMLDIFGTDANLSAAKFVGGRKSRGLGNYNYVFIDRVEGQLLARSRTYSAGNVEIHVYTLGKAAPHPEDIAQDILAKLTAGGGPPPSAGRANSQLESQGSAGNPPLTPVPQSQAPAADPGQAATVPAPPQPVQDVLDSVNKLKDVFRGLIR